MDIELLLLNLNNSGMLGNREKEILSFIQSIELIEEDLVEFTCTSGYSFLTNIEGTMIM
ncbi:hypothetical protein ACR77J_07815 [Tissierella praeacuta]|uniref:hypothetical protein n=1 Tax=Tissierella praeacuta TaxID=43131 RepID=UPI003DA1D200